MMRDPREERAEEAEELEDWNTALGLWKELAESTQEVHFFLSYGSAARKLERWQEAEDALVHALSLDPASSLTMENLGVLWANRTDKDEDDSLQTAKYWFLQALTLERHARLLTFLGSAHAALNDEPGARCAFEEAIALDSEYEEALYNLASLDEETNPSKAMDLLEKAIVFDPNYLLAHQALGRLTQKAEDLIGAEYHFRRCLEINPSDYWSNLYWPIS